MQDTNLSQRKTLERFKNLVNPEKVLEIVFSTHVLEREKRNLSLKKLRLLRHFIQKTIQLLIAESYIHLKNM